MLETIDRSSGRGVAEQIRERLKLHIANLSPGDRIPNEIALCKRFKASRMTVSKAIGSLVDEGHLYRIRSKGTFVGKSPRKKTLTKNHMIGVVCPTNAEIFSDIFQKMVNILAPNNYFAIPVDTEPEQDKEKRFLQMLDYNPEHVFIDAHYYYPIEHPIKWRSRINRLTFFNRFSFDMPFPRDVNYILSDYMQGGRLLGKHMLEGSNGKALFVNWFDTVPSPNIAQAKIIDGVQHEMSEMGINLKENIKVLDNYKPTFQEDLLKCIDQGFVNIFCGNDFRASLVYEAVQGRNIKIGKDIKVGGYFDTRKGMELSPALTTVSLNINELASYCCQAALEEWRGQKILVKPQLIIKESTGGVRESAAQEDIWKHY